MAEKIIVLIIGGAFGTLCRYFLSHYLGRAMGVGFPCGTFVVNALGCFLIGLFASLAETKFIFGPHARLLLMVGFCGAFTTFSTFIFETSYLVNDGEIFGALLNIVLSVVVGFGLFRLGLIVGKLI